MLKNLITNWDFLGRLQFSGVEFTRLLRVETPRTFKGLAIAFIQTSGKDLGNKLSGTNTLGLLWRLESGIPCRHLKNEYCHGGFFYGNSMLPVATFGPQGPNFTCKSIDCIYSSRPKEAQILEFKGLLFWRVADFRHHGWRNWTILTYRDQSTIKQKNKKLMRYSSHVVANMIIIEDLHGH